MNNLKLKIFGASAIGLFVFALREYIKEKKQTFDEKVKQQLEDLLDQLDDRFSQMNQEQIFQEHNIMNCQQYIDQLIKQLIDFKKLKEEILQINFIKQQLSTNKNSYQLIEQDYVTLYLTQFSFKLINETTIEQIAKQNQIIQQDCNYSTQQQLNFINFIKLSFLQIICQIEQIFQDDNINQKKIELVNFLIILQFNTLDQLLIQNKELCNIVAEALLSDISYLLKLYQLQHDCDDLYLVSPLKNCEENSNCKCCIFDLLCRYISVFSTVSANKIFQFIKIHQIFSTQQHLLQVGKIICKNSFYLGGQLSQDSLHYLEETSIIHNLLILATSNKQIQLQLAESEEIFVHFSYIERVINSHDYAFLNKLLHNLIHNYIISYPLFHNLESLNLLLRSDEKTKSIISTFFGVLLSLETRENYDSNKPNQINIRDWFAMNMGSLLTNQILSNIQVLFIQELLKVKHIQQELLFTYLYCLRASQNKRIQDRQQKKKFVEINSPITKIISLIIISRMQNDFSIKNMNQVIDNLGFVDQEERENVFLNILKIQFEMPSMNLNYLKYVAVKCSQLSDESYNSYNGYFANMMNCKTLSYDTYMVSMQFAASYGKIDQFLAGTGQAFLKDLQDYQNYREFLQRDLILLVDIMENPFYFYNILIRNQQQSPQMQQKLIKNVAIALWQLNPKINFNVLIQQIGLFIEIPKDYHFITQLFVFQNQQQIKLKDIYENCWPFMCLQRDFTTIQQYLKLVADDVIFSELLINECNLEFIDKIQEKFFKSQNFVQIIYQLLFNVNRLDMRIWIGKILFYAKKFKNLNRDLIQLFQSKECQSFINEMPTNYRQYMLQ